MRLQDLLGVIVHPFQHRDVEQEKPVGVVDLVRHPRDQRPERGHLVGLDQPVLVAAQLLQRLVALGDLPGQLPGPYVDPPLQGLGPEHRGSQDAQEGEQDHDAVLEDQFLVETGRLLDPEPFFVDLVVLSGLDQDGQPLVEAGQKFPVPVDHGVAVLVAPHRLGHRDHVGQVQFADQVHAGEHGEHGVVVLSRGEQAQHLRRSRRQHQFLVEAHLLEALVHDAVAEHDDLLAPQFLQALDRRRLLPGENGLVHDGVRR